MDEKELMEAQQLAMEMNLLLGGKRNELVANTLAILVANFAMTASITESRSVTPPDVMRDVGVRAGQFLIQMIQNNGKLPATRQ